MPAPADHGRQREVPQQDLEASTVLKLGEFENVPSLTLSEARLIINTILKTRQEKGVEIQITDTLSKTQDYLEVFARFKEKENIEAVERLLFSVDLKPFERSQLGSLCCDNAEEAKSLIPSLQDRISDDDLQEILDELTKLRNFVE